MSRTLCPGICPPEHVWDCSLRALGAVFRVYDIYYVTRISYLWIVINFHFDSTILIIMYSRNVLINCVLKVIYTYLLF